MSNYFSYSNVLNDIVKFKKSGSRNGGEFNYADTPGQKYFKLFFYFNNGDIDGVSSGAQNGLLSPTWLINGVNDSNYYLYNSAWSYLKMNYEDERAELLKQFVNLLSNISSESPWYFSELSGVDAALERPVYKEFKFEEDRKKISIKCLPDAYDDRIATLLDLYRSIVWSWSMKREVLPTNLRKFDMGLFIFDAPTTPYNSRSNYIGNEFNDIGESEEFMASYKYVEFHNCEIDYNSSKSALGALNNKDGISPEYTIDISFDDCYETRYNEYIGKALGDMIRWDIDYSATYEEEIKFFDQSEFFDFYNDVERSAPENKKIEAKKATKENEKKGFLQTAANELIGHAKQFVGGVIKKAVLGNMHTFSLVRAADQVKDALSGHVFATANAIKSYEPDTSKDNNIKYVAKIGNMYKNETIKNNI